MKRIILIAIIASLFLISGCAEEQIGKSDQISIVTTLYPLYEFSKAAGGEKADVLLLLPPGTEPHAYDPKPSDIRRIANADIFVYTGDAMEPWAKDILTGIDNPGLIVIDSSHGLEMRKHEEDHGHGKHDPHIWLDFENDKHIITSIADVLALKDSENKAYYNQNADDYVAKLDELDYKFSSGLADCEHNEFITGGHSAFSYLAQRYGLEQISVFGLSPDAEPTPKRIVEMTELAKEKGFNYIFFEELVNPKTAQVIADEVGAETLMINPAASLTKEQMEKGYTFISVMENNLENLRVGLGCKVK
ncbi:MAG: zinc ABC transporter substrate-binding protein [Nanoarchaeota archaeon]|nr:zinc ABC transporter substrate-binding protein [Nanoarchaeota archaeon]